jgi:hypothetical protein
MTEVQPFHYEKIDRYLRLKTIQNGKTLPFESVWLCLPEERGDSESQYLGRLSLIIYNS